MNDAQILANAPDDDSWKYHFYMTEAKTEVYSNDFPLCDRAWVRYGNCLSLQDICDEISGCYEFHDVRLRSDIETIVAQGERIAELERALEKETIRKNESYRQEEIKEEENRELRRKVFRSFGDDEYWIFSDDGEDYVDSLVCPCVMSAAKLRELVKARTELEQLKAAQPKWISVDDRLPDESMEGMTILCGTTSGTCIACVGKKGVFLEEFRGLRLSLKVTHWIPLPTPPEGE